MRGSAARVRPPEQRVLVRCHVCHLRFDVSARTHRDIKAGRVEARCMLHRKRRARPETTTAAMRRWWLDRFPMEECVEMGQAIESMLGPRLRVERSMLALSASATGPTGPP